MKMPPLVSPLWMKPLNKTFARCLLGALLPWVASHALAVLPPAYLSVPKFKQCLATQQTGTSRTWCLPSRKPRSCLAASWKQLRSQADSDHLPRCRANV